MIKSNQALLNGGIDPSISFTKTDGSGRAVSFAEHNITQFVDSIYTNNTVSEMKYFNNQLFKNFSPDINGYNLVFMVPPDFTFLEVDPMSSEYRYIQDFRKLVTFAAVDFTPPQQQVQSETVSSRNGGIPYATEVGPSEQCSITFIDNSSLDIFNFHLIWVDYIKKLIEGEIDVYGEFQGSGPGKDFMTYDNGANELYGALDYAASAFIVKYDPSMKLIKYVGKVTGIYPQSLPSKELLGQRTSNEITTLPFTYFCAYYEESTQKDSIIYNELDDAMKVSNFVGE